MTKNTTSKFYHNGYNAAQDNQPRRSPHRDGTNSETIWLEGYNAYINGDTPPEQPRKKRTKKEMEEAQAVKTSNINTPNRELPRALNMFHTESLRADHAKNREPSLIDNIIAAKEKIKTETNAELRETLHMELADLEWYAFADDGKKPSTVWEEYKAKNGLDFDRKVA